MELTLNQKLSLIQKEFKASKSKFNSFGKYNFRSAEDILEALKPYNEKYQVNFTITECMVESQFIQFPMLESTASINDDLDTISASAIVGVDLEQKGMQMPQKFGSASSYAKKYALGNLSTLKLTLINALILFNLICLPFFTVVSYSVLLFNF